jgi:hypothetical protein
MFCRKSFLIQFFIFLSLLAPSSSFADKNKIFDMSGEVRVLKDEDLSNIPRSFAHFFSVEREDLSDRQVLLRYYEDFLDFIRTYQPDCPQESIGWFNKEYADHPLFGAYYLNKAWMVAHELKLEDGLIQAAEVTPEVSVYSVPEFAESMSIQAKRIPDTQHWQIRRQALVEVLQEVLLRLRSAKPAEESVKRLDTP